MPEIVIGRRRDDLEKYGKEGTGFIGRHIVGKGDEAHLTVKVLMDFLRPHLVMIVGKRGSGKSYSGAVIAEELALLPEEYRKNFSVILVDTMGIFWSMKYPNEEQIELLHEWGLEPRGFDNVKIYAPISQKKEFEEVGIEIDFGISVEPWRFEPEDWSMAFNLPRTSPHAIALEKVINKLKERNEKFMIDDIIAEIKDDRDIDTHIKDALENMLIVADKWGIFGTEGIPIERMLEAGTINVFDVSHLRATEAWSVRNLLVAMLARDVYEKRVIARRLEELARMGEMILEKRFPMVWMIVDEAHNFVGSEYVTPSTEPFLTIVKQGRQPGISLVVMTQMPNKLHPEVIAQTDLVISHRLTAKSDLDALHGVMQNYMREDLWKYLNALPRWRGAAIVLDDNSERILPIRVRPRLSWHAGESAIAVLK